MIIPDSAPLVPITTYLLNAIPYIPHYIKPKVYVAPGGATMTQKKLIVLNATPTTMMLWPRRWCAE